MYVCVLGGGGGMQEVHVFSRDIICIMEFYPVLSFVEL